jgi:hypothetical protein
MRVDTQIMQGPGTDLGKAAHQGVNRFYVKRRVSDQMNQGHVWEPAR